MNVNESVGMLMSEMLVVINLTSLGCFQNAGYIGVTVEIKYFYAAAREWKYFCGDEARRGKAEEQ